MIFERILDFLVKRDFLLGTILLSCIIISAVLFGVYWLCRKKASKFTAQLMHCAYVFLAVWSILFIVRISIFACTETYIGGSFFGFVDILFSPAFLIAAVVFSVKWIWNVRHGKVILTGISLFLAVVFLFDMAAYSITRRSENVFEEIYWSMRDVDDSWENKISKVETLEIWREKFMLSVPAYKYYYTTGGDYRVTEAIYSGIDDPKYTGSVFCIHETGKLVFYFSNEGLRSWLIYEYDTNTNELCYSSSSGAYIPMNNFLFDNILPDWFEYLGNKSRFHVGDLGEYSDVGYRKSDPYIWEIVG